MTVSILGCWEIGYRTPLSEINDWEFMLKEFGVLDLNMTPASGIRTGLVQDPANLVLTEIASNGVEAFLAQKRSDGVSIVFVDESGTTDLPEFTHPENCLYVFGRSSASLISYKTVDDVAIKIPTLANQGGFWAYQAASIVLYDRFLKDV